MPTPKTTTLFPANVAQTMRAKGWTLRTAARVLGVNFAHLHRVLCGERPSETLLRRVHSLPRRPGPLPHLRKH